MSPPGVFRIILLALAIQCSHQQEADCTYSNNCDTSANVAKISCLSNHFGVVVDCTCEDEDAGVSCGEVGDLAGVTDIDDALCIAYCEASVLSCMFWKLTDRGGTKICYLMDQDQCQAKDSSDECPEFNSQGEQECWGGNVDGTAGKPTCQDGTDSGGGSSCPGPITTFAENPTKFYQKWKCFDNTKITEVNMYEENAEMPLGGYCLLDEDNGGRYFDKYNIIIAMLLIIPSAANQQTQTSNLSVRGTKPIIPSNGPRDQMQLMIQVIFLLL